jgi:methylamine dehydrogenase heavy chain
MRPSLLPATLFSIFVALTLPACEPERVALTPAEEGALEMPDPDPHRFIVMEPLWIAPAGQFFVVDGAQQKFLAQIDGGYLPRAAFSPDQKEIYVSETFWERGTRGKRSDVITFYDAKTLHDTGEVLLPAGRFVTGTKKYTFSGTPDGQYLLSLNVTPAVSVSLVDARRREYLGEIETPGCTLVLPSGPARFSMICTDNTLLTVKIRGADDYERSRSEAFFNASEDPLMDQPDFERATSTAWFVSYAGMIHAIDLREDEPKFAEPWSIVTASEKAANWRPGGTQMIAANSGAGRLFVLMHEGEPWTHKEAGTEVWVFDMQTRKKIGRIKLAYATDSIAVSRDAENPRLYALASEDSIVTIYDAQTLASEGEIEEMGYYSAFLYVAGD